MNRSMFAVRPLGLTLVLALCNSAAAQLQITEIMYNPVATNDDGWEWIEVRNTGAAPVDLVGSFLDRLDDSAIPVGGTPNISVNAMNTIIPAGGVAVIYDGFVSSGSPSNYDDQLFRDAWSLDASVPLIAADFFPFLVNSGGGSIGIWADRASYDADLVLDNSDPEDPVMRVGSFTNATVSIEFGHTSPWPSGGNSNGKSIEWSGNGVNTDGAQWSFSAVDQRGAVLSTPAVGQGALNNTDDYANPGDVFSSASGTPSAGLYITEIMYNPASNDALWEWVEVYNNTGATIDFSDTNYVFDDDDDADLTAPNVTTGSIDNGEIAVLYNDALTQEQVEAAWGDTINFIPVANFTGLGNSGDLVALWPSLAAYEAETDPNPGPARTSDNAIAQVLFSNNANGFPDDNGSSSIYVSSFVEGTELTGDYNGDGEVNNADYTVWRDTLGSNTDLRANGDDSNSVIDQADYDAWIAHFGETGGAGTTLTWALDTPPAGNSFSPEEVFGDVTVHPGGDVASPGTFIPIALDGSGSAVVPEPASVVLLLTGTLACAFLRRRR